MSNTTGIDLRCCGRGAPGGRRGKFKEDLLGKYFYKQNGRCWYVLPGKVMKTVAIVTFKQRLHRLINSHGDGEILIMDRQM